MKILKKVKVGGHIYKVKFPYHFKEVSQLFGQTDHSSLEIRITDIDFEGNPLPASKIWLNFLHEIFHCVDKVYNAHTIEEIIVERMAEGLFQVLTDNFIIKPKAKDEK